MKLWGWDTETFLKRRGLAAPRMVCGTWSNGVEDFIGTPKQTIQFLADALERGEHLVGVATAYDLVVAAAMEPDLLPLIFKAGDAGQFHDCAIREALHDIAIDKLFKDYKTGKSFAKRDPETGEMSGRYSMQILMMRHFEIDISSEKTGDVWRFKYAKLEGVPFERWPKEAIDYAKRDARRAREICVAQKNHRNKHDEPAQMRASIAIQLMVTWGFRTDGAYLDHLEKEVDALWNSAREEFSKVGIFRPNGTKDTARLAAMVSAAYGGKPPKTPTGKISTDRDTLTGSGDPTLERFGSLGKNDKRKTLYIPALRKGVHAPINPEFNLLVATGRVSSDWQQLPQKGGLREGIICRPGRVRGSLDYGGLELRTMSQRAIRVLGFSKMAEFINKKKDPHCHVAATWLRISYDEAEAKHKAKDPLLKTYRDIGKVYNFGKGGGMGAKAMVYQARAKDGISFCLLFERAKKCMVRTEETFVQGKKKRICSSCVEIAKELDAGWLEAWPEQQMLFDMAGRLTANGKHVDCEIFSSKRVRGGCGYTQWLNTPFQGAGGDGMKAAMWRIARECYTNRRSPLWGSRIELNIHDELWIDFPDEPQRRHDAAFLAAKIMVDTMNEITPDVKNEVTPALMRRTFKAASDVYDREKRLKPWWPSDWKWGPDQEQMQLDMAA